MERNREPEIDKLDTSILNVNVAFLNDDEGECSNSHLNCRKLTQVLS